MKGFRSCDIPSKSRYILVGDRVPPLQKSAAGAHLFGKSGAIINSIALLTIAVTIMACERHALAGRRFLGRTGGFLREV